MVSLSIVSTWLGTKLAEKAFDKVYGKYFDGAETLEKELKASIDKVSINLSAQYPDILGSSIEYFFKKEEVFNNLIKILFSYANEDILEFSNRFFDVTTLPPNFILEFIKQLKFELQNKINFSRLLNDKELYVAVRGLGEELEITAATSSLAFNEIKEIKDLLASRLQDTSFDYYNFYNTYKTVAVNNLSQVTFIGLGIETHIKRSRKKLDDVFVKPYFRLSKISDKGVYGYEALNNDETFDVSSFKDDVLIRIDEIFDNKKNLVVLGDPGSGKSFIVKYIICSLLVSNYKNFHNKNVFIYLPIRIELRKYLYHKKSHNCNLTGYIGHLFDTEYNIILNSNNIDFILSNRKVLILFDGLDEIFDVGDKNQIKNDIENFCLANHSVRAIVTSRFIGYAEARLQEHLFDEIQIQQFNDNQIIDYVEKWYENEEDDEETRSREIREFLNKKSKLDNELTRNPLLLSLIVILFRNNLKLPESKLEIYQSCTKTLVEKWDASKNLEISLDEILIKKKETILADLAYWQYQTLSTKTAKITYQKAKRAIADCILNKLKISDNLIEALSLSEKFLQYAENRSIYFDNNFTHKTFLEYYTAYWIYSNYDKKQLSDQRDQLINKYISNSFWAIVLELLLNLIDNDQPDNEIIDNIYIEQSKNPDSLPFLVEVLPTLENISNNQKVEIIRKSIDKILATKIRRHSKSHTAQGNNLFEIISKTIAQDVVLINLFNNIYAEYAKKVDKSEDAIRFLIFGYEFSGNNHGRIKLIPNEVFNNLINSDSIYLNIIEKNPYLWMQNLFANKKMVEYDFNDVSIFLNLFGKEMFFEDYHAMYASYSLMGIYHYFANGQIKYSLLNFRKSLSCLVESGLEEKLISNKYKDKIFVYCDENELRTIITMYNVPDQDTIVKKLLGYAILRTIQHEKNILKKVREILPIEILSKINQH